MFNFIYKEKIKMKRNESGRSMVEMLGVLAIIGVLSIGGIAGYTLAMNRYRANEVLDAASKLAIIAMSKDGGFGSNANLAVDLNNMKVPAVASMESDREGVVTVTFDGDQTKVANIVAAISGNRASSCTSSSCTLNLQDAVK